MVVINGTYKGPHFCESTHQPSSVTLATDAPLDNGGSGKEFSPTDLLATSYVTCMMTIMSLTAAAHDISLIGAQYSVEKHMTAEKPRRIKKLDIRLNLPATVPDDNRAELIEKARSCPVALSVHPDVEIACDIVFDVQI